MSNGIKHMLIAGVFFSLMNLGVKYVPHIPAVEVVFFRAFISLIMSFIILKKAKIPIWGNNRKILFLRGLFGVISLIMYFSTLQSMPFASAVTLMQLSPIFTILLGIFILGEKVKPMQLLFFAISFLGVVIIKGFDTRISIGQLAMAIGAAFGAGLAYNMVRKLKDTDHPVVVVFYFPLIAMPVAGIISAFNWVMPQGKDWLILLGIGMATQIAQVEMTKALQLEKLAKVSIVRYLTVVYAIILGYCLFNESYSIAVFIGIGLVVLGVILNLLFQKNKA